VGIKNFGFKLKNKSQTSDKRYRIEQIKLDR
jgi:hypothetical protein